MKQEKRKTKLNTQWTKGAKEGIGNENKQE